MKRKIFSIFFAVVLVLTMSLVAAPAAAGHTSPGTIYVDAAAGSGGDGSSGSPFDTIGEAITHAGSGDTINVAAGTYAENVVLPGSIDITLLGAQADVDPTAGGRTDPGSESILDGWVSGPSHDTGDGITLPDDAGTVVINGFTIQGYEYGIQGTESGGVVGATISYNILDDNGNDGTAPEYNDPLNNVGGGIRVYNMDTSTISYNVVKNGERGIRLDDASGSGSDGNTVSHNLIHDNEQYGIAIYTGGDDNTIEYNKIYNSADRGIQLGWGASHSGNVIQYNEIYDINNDGILITNATDFTIKGNTIYNTAFTNQTFGRPTGGPTDSFGFSIQAVHGGIALIGTNSNVTITGNVLHDNGEMDIGNPWSAISNAITSTPESDGIWLSSASTAITVHENSIYNNNEYGLENENTGVTTDARYNWWGHEDGPQADLGQIPDGENVSTGDKVSDYVHYDPWLPGQWTGTSVGLTADVPDIIAISVSPSSIDFGTVMPGQTAPGDNIIVTNIGTHEVDVNASIPTGTVLQYLELWGGAWSDRNWTNIITNLAMGNYKTIPTQLPVPPGYTPSGSEEATLLFIARAS